MSQKNIESRLKWMSKHVSWTMEQSKQVCVSNELTSTLKPTSRQKYGWTNSKQRYHPSNMVPTFKSGYESISLWGCFSAFRRSNLVRTESILNQTKFLKLLQDHVQTFASKNRGGFDQFIFQHDNCAAHKAKLELFYMNKKGYNEMEWPPQIPDLNPLENVLSIEAKTIGPI